METGAPSPIAFHPSCRGLRAAAVAGQEAKAQESGSRAKEEASKAPKFMSGTAPAASVDSWMAHMERELAPAELSELQSASTSRTKPVDAPDHPDFKVRKVWIFRMLYVGIMILHEAYDAAGIPCGMSAWPLIYMWAAGCCVPTSPLAVERQVCPPSCSSDSRSLRGQGEASDPMG